MAEEERKSKWALLFLLLKATIMTSFHASYFPRAPFPNINTVDNRVSTCEFGARGHIQSVTGKFLLSQIEFGNNDGTHCTQLYIAITIQYGNLSLNLEVEGDSCIIFLMNLQVSWVVLLIWAGLADLGFLTSVISWTAGWLRVALAGMALLQGASHPPGGYPRLIFIKVAEF